MAIRFTVQIKLVLLSGFVTTALAQQVPPATPPTQQVPSLEQLLQQQTEVDPALIEVSTSARYVQNSGQSSQVTYIVTDEEISNFSLRTVGEILSFLPGLYVSTDGTYGYLTARGIGRPGDYNSRLLFLVDGTRVNDNIYDAGLIGSNFYIDPQLIERVEYSPGSGSAVYGNNAFLGVVNIITKRGLKMQGTKLGLQQTDDHQRQWTLSYGDRDFTGREGWLSYSHSQRQQIGFSKRNSPSFLTAQQALNTDLNHKLAGSYRYRRWQLQLAGVSRTREEPVVVDQKATLADMFRTENLNYFASLQHGVSLNDQVELYSHLSTNSFHLKTFTPFVVPSGQQRQYVFDVLGQWSNLDVRLSYTPAAAHHLLVGIDGQRDHHQSYQFSIDQQIPIQDVQSDNFRSGVFVQHDWQLFADHRFISGFRYDYSKQNVREFSPKIGWVWQGLKKHNFRLSYGSAFRAPNEYEQKSNLYVLMEAPAPELIETLEGGWQGQFDNGWSAGLSLYRSAIRDLIAGKANQSSGVEFYNDPRVSSYGLEAILVKKWQHNTQLQVSASLQRSQYQSGQALSNAPERLFKADFSKRLWRDDLYLNWRLFAASSRLSAVQTWPGFARHDLLLSWQGQQAWTVVLGFKNILDQRYLDAPLPSAEGLLQPGRSAELFFQWSFQ